jgi:hypothetical protein
MVIQSTIVVDSTPRIDSLAVVQSTLIDGSISRLVVMVVQSTIVVNSIFRLVDMVITL